MKITKLGHCCLLLESKGRTILTDPGAYSDAQNAITGIDAVLITHEHADHLHLESLKMVLQNNPQAKIYTNRGVGAILEKEKLAFEVLEHGQTTEFFGVSLAGLGEKHAPIYPGVPEVINTGYLIDNYLFYPGDAFYVPAQRVEVLALPVAGPWMRLSEAVDYAKQVKPHTAFPVHDGALKTPGLAHRLPHSELEKFGIRFLPMEPGQAIDV
ncbi:MAG: MBL fold metallo-hydrolase [Patescibacteria group bacterium]|nr:MBL fold metallo-hydrolase [Patescibacteria group bacterium]